MQRYEIILEWGGFLFLSGGPPRGERCNKGGGRRYWIDGVTLRYEDVPMTYARCFCEGCVRAGECLRHAVALLAPDRPMTGPCVFPQSVRAGGGCPFFRPMRAYRMACFFTSLFRNVLARDSAVLRRKVTDYLGSHSTYIAITGDSSVSLRVSRSISWPFSPNTDTPLRSCRLTTISGISCTFDFCFRELSFVPAR